jgi:hypothetical protein
MLFLLFIVQPCFFAGSGGYYFSTSSRKGIYMKTEKQAAENL